MGKSISSTDPHIIVYEITMGVPQRQRKEERIKLEYLRRALKSLLKNQHQETIENGSEKCVGMRMDEARDLVDNVSKLNLEAKAFDFSGPPRPGSPTSPGSRAKFLSSMRFIKK